MYDLSITEWSMSSGEQCQCQHILLLWRSMWIKKEFYKQWIINQPLMRCKLPLLMVLATLWIVFICMCLNRSRGRPGMREQMDGMFFDVLVESSYSANPGKSWEILGNYEKLQHDEWLTSCKDWYKVWNEAPKEVTNNQLISIILTLTSSQQLKPK